MGSSLSSVLRTQAKELRDKHRQRMREKAYKIPVKLLFPIMLIFFTIFIITLGPTLIKLKKILGKELAGKTQAIESNEGDSRPAATG